MSSPFAVGLVVMLAHLALAAAAAELPSPAVRLLESPRPLVIGHRGFPAVAPENTLASFDRALAVGVDLVELDYHHTSDGIPLVIHDGTLDRTTDAVARWGGKDLSVGKRTAAELGTLEAGNWFKPAFPGERLPTLEQALAFIQARGATLIERKGGDPATLSRLLRAHDYVNRLVVQSFDWEFLAAFHAVEPTQVLGALGPVSHRGGRKVTDEEKALNGEWLELVKATGSRAVVWNRQVDAASVRRAHEMGLKVWVYTIDEESVAAGLLAAGVDGIISNHPGLIWKVLATTATSAVTARR